MFKMENSIAEMLDSMKEDLSCMDAIFSYLPAEIRSMLESDEFKQVRQEEFSGLDADGSGTLELGELYPLLEAISELEAFATLDWDISMDNCRQFMKLFDTNRDGVLEFSEYVFLVKYVVAMAYLRGIIIFE